MLDDPVARLSAREAALGLLVGVFLVVGMVWTARPAGSGVGWRLAFVTLHLTSFGLLVAILRRAAPSLRQLLAAAVVLRVVALPMQPSLSDDGYRYLWDGLVTNEADISPYQFRPSDPRLAAWRGEVLYERMNSPDYHSVYPPASQAVFRVAALAYRPFGWAASWCLLKLMLVGVELVGVVALARVVGAGGAALYAWSPLAVVEIAGQGHTEALVVAGLGLVLCAGVSRVPVASIGVTIAGLSKLYPLALLPAAWRREGWRGIAASAGLAAALSALAWPPGGLKGALGSLTLFFGTFDQYAAPYRLVKAALYPLIGEPAGEVASVGLALAYAAAVGVALLADDGTPGSLRAVMGLVVCGVALTASTLHPWYWLPVVFVLPLLKPTNLLWAALWTAALSTLTYIDYELPRAGFAALVVGWGGGLVLFFLSLRHTDGPASPGRRWPRRDRL